MNQFAESIELYIGQLVVAVANGDAHRYALIAEAVDCMEPEEQVQRDCVDFLSTIIDISPTTESPLIAVAMGRTSLLNTMATEGMFNEIKS